MNTKQVILRFLLTIGIASIISLILTAAISKIVYNLEENKNIKQILDIPVKVLTLHDDQGKEYYAVPIQRDVGDYTGQKYEIYER